MKTVRTLKQLLTRPLGTHSLVTAAALFVGSLTPLALHAQPQITAQQLADLQQVAPSQIPRYATFWEWYYGRNGQAFAAPLPLNPYGPEVPVYYLQDGEYLIDNGPDDLPLAAQQPQLQAEGLLQPLDASGTTAQPNEASLFDGGFAPGTFYICSVGVTNQVITLVLTNTVQDTLYEIQSKDALTNTADWVSEGTFSGLDGSTLITLSMGNRTNQLWLRAKSWGDSSGSGIPDWWWQQYGLTNVTDPYTFCASGDGYTLMDAYHNNWNPGSFYTPAAPHGLAIKLDSGGTTITVSWQPSDGAVTAYTLERWDPTTGTTQFPTLATNQTSYSDSFAAGRKYRVQALYGWQGPSAWSAYVSLNARMPYAVVVRGPQGRSYLAISGMPSSVVQVHLTASWSQGSTNFDVPVMNLHKGIIELPQCFNAWQNTTGQGAPNWSVQTVDANGILSDTISAGAPSIVPYFDGRAQLADNLAFLVRDTRYGPFEFESIGWPWGFEAPADYAYASFSGGQPEGYLPYLLADFISEFRPFQENYFFRNFIFTPLDSDATGMLTNGLAPDWWGPLVTGPLKYSFPYPTNLLWTPPPVLLNFGQNQWTLNMEILDPSYMNIQDNYQGSYVMATGYGNIFGLACTSAEFAHNNGSGLQLTTLYPGQAIPITGGYFYGACDPPNFLTTNYYFGRLGVDALPGDTQSSLSHLAFSPTNTTPLMVASVGQQRLKLAGYAQQILLNGDQTLPAYLGQYFDKAYLADTNNEATTNETGLLSEYGEFFPTEPGLNLLTTKPDLTQTTNLQGQCPLHVIALATDVNHDGMIDPSFGGQDFTSWYRPFRFWVNDTYDEGDDIGSGIPGTGYGGFGDEPACAAITSTRSLVNLFPVQVCVQSLLKAVPSLSTLTFKLSNAGRTLYYVETDLTPDNYRDYLTSNNFLGSLPRYWGSAGHIDQEFPATLTTNFLAKIRDEGKGILLMEASGPTTAPLNLEVWQGTNLLATTSLYLSIQPVEQMFRHKNLIRETFPSATSAGAPGDRLTDADVPNEPETSEKNFVFLHGYNVNPEQARGAFADVFKRMFWSGSHAKFYGVTWLGADTQGDFFFPLTGIRIPGTGGITPNYHTNVFHAFQTAPKLADFLNTITNGSTTVAAHSLGNMVALDALSECNALMDRYFMIDAAVAIEAVQSNAPQTNTMVYSDWAENGYTNRLYSREWHALFGTGDGRSSLSWTNRLANFHNTDVYNFYSSGEEVLRNFTDVPPTGVLSAAPDQVAAALKKAVGAWVWVWQEKGKGRATSNGYIASSHGGWGWNRYEQQYYWHTNGGDGGMEVAHLDPVSAAKLPNEQLKTNAFFDMTYDTPLFAADSSGSDYAFAKGNRILSDAIPALTLPIGANPVPMLSPPQNPVERNFDMQISYENGWPSGRGNVQVGNTPAFGEWHHSDFRQVAYPFNYSLYDSFVNFGNLK